MKLLIKTTFVLTLYLTYLFPQNDTDQSILNVNFLYNLTLEELLEVSIVSAAKVPEKIKDVPASVVLITKKDIQKYGYTNLVEILDNVPGLYGLKNRDFMGTAFGIRGYYSGWPKNIIFLINGVDQASVYNVYFQPLLNIPVESIDRIEIVRGPMSVIYGSGAFFGSINIVTDEISEPRNSYVSISGGSEYTGKISGKLSAKFEDLSLSVSAGYIKSDGPDESLEKMVTDISLLEQFGISYENNNVTTKNRLEDENIYLNMTGKYKGFTANIGYQESNKEELHFWPSPDEGLLDRRRFTSISLSYDKQVTKNLLLKGTIRQYNFSYWRDFDYFIPDFFGHELNESNKSEFELSFNYTPLEKFNIHCGVNYKITDEKFKLDIRKVVILNTGYNLSDVSVSSQYIQFNYLPFPELRIIGGIRFETMPKYPIYFINNESGQEINSSYDAGTEFISRIAFIYSLNSKNILKLLYGTGAMFPGGMDIVSNKFSYYPDLKAEKIKTFEVNYISIINSNLFINFSVFHNNLDNLISVLLEFDESGTNWAPRRTNEGEMTTNGVELSINGNLSQNHSFEFGAVYQKTENFTSGRENQSTGYSPNLLGYVKTTYNITLNSIISLTGKFVDEMETLWDVSKLNADGNLGARIAKKADNYFLLDASLRLNNLFDDNYYLSFRCTNIFNTDYLYPLYTSNSSWADKGTFGDSRKFMLTLGYKF